MEAKTKQLCRGDLQVWMWSWRMFQSAKVKTCQQDPRVWQFVLQIWPTSFPLGILFVTIACDQQRLPFCCNCWRLWGLATAVVLTLAVVLFSDVLPCFEKLVPWLLHRVSVDAAAGELPLTAFQFPVHFSGLSVLFWYHSWLLIASTATGKIIMNYEWFFNRSYGDPEPPRTRYYISTSCLACLVWLSSWACFLHQCSCTVAAVFTWVRIMPSRRLDLFGECLEGFRTSPRVNKMGRCGATNAFWEDPIALQAASKKKTNLHMLHASGREFGTWMFWSLWARPYALPIPSWLLGRADGWPASSSSQP